MAKYLGFKRIYEAPIELNFDKIGSSVSTNLIKIVLLTLKDALGIFYRMRLIGYYSDKNQRKWKFDPELNFRVNIP